MCTNKLVAFGAIFTYSFLVVSGIRLIPNGTKTIHKNGGTHVVKKFFVVPDNYNEKITYRSEFIKQAKKDSSTNGIVTDHASNVNQEDIDENYSKNDDVQEANSEEHNNNKAYYRKKSGHDNHVAETQAASGKGHIHRNPNTRTFFSNYITYKTDPRGITSSNFEDSLSNTQNKVNLNVKLSDSKSNDQIYSMPSKTYKFVERRYKTSGLRTDNDLSEANMDSTNKISMSQDVGDFRKKMFRINQAVNDGDLKFHSGILPGNTATSYRWSINYPDYRASTSNEQNSIDYETATDTENNLTAFSKARGAYDLDIQNSYKEIPQEVTRSKTRRPTYVEDDTDNEKDITSDGVAAFKEQINIYDPEMNQSGNAIRPTEITYYDGELHSGSKQMTSNNHILSSEVYNDQVDSTEMESKIIETTPTFDHITLATWPIKTNNDLQHNYHISELPTISSYNVNEKILKNTYDYEPTKADYVKRILSSESSNELVIPKVKTNVDDSVYSSSTSQIPDFSNIGTTTDNPVLRVSHIGDKLIRGTSENDKYRKIELKKSMSDYYYYEDIDYKKKASDRPLFGTAYYDIDEDITFKDNILGEMPLFTHIRPKIRPKPRVSLNYYNNYDYTYAEDMFLNKIDKKIYNKLYSNRYNSMYGTPNIGIYLNDPYIDNVSKDINRFLMKQSIQARLGAINRLEGLAGYANPYFPLLSQAPNYSVLQHWQHPLSARIWQQYVPNINNYFDLNGNQVNNDKILKFMNSKYSANNYVSNIYPHDNIYNSLLGKYSKSYPELNTLNQSILDGRHFKVFSNGDNVDPVRKAVIESKYNLRALKDYLIQVFLLTKANNINEFKKVYDNVLNFIEHLDNKGVNKLVINEVIRNVKQYVYNGRVCSYCYNISY